MRFAGWTLFLDRDGVINERIPDGYVSDPKAFQFLPGAVEAIRDLRSVFQRQLVVTNQQGIGKKLMSEGDLAKVHSFMISELQRAGASLDAVYFCPDLKTKSNNCRKPSSTMAMQAKADFPDIDFSRSVMVGDSASDIAFGQNLGMFTVFIQTKEGEESILMQQELLPDAIFTSLRTFADWALNS